MALLNNYHQFDGRHPETGSIHNIFAYQGITAPHTGKPYSEAFLLGVSGGITFGYFTFDYEGYDPILALLTRNTFDPLQTILERLGVSQFVEQTSNSMTGEKKLEEALENGRPALVWADLFSLPYSGLTTDEKNWDMQPLVVYGIQGGVAFLADRSGIGLQVPVEMLTAARGRVKKDKYRVITLDPPDERKLPAAVQQGIWQCIRLFTEKPPKGSRDNFGFAALRKWADLLVNRRSPHGWERYFPPGVRLYAALAGTPYLPGAYGWINLWGTASGADRSTYADFLDEAAVLLKKPVLGEAGELFRKSAQLWRTFADALLPDNIPLLGEIRRLKDHRHRLFVDQGDAVQAKIREINIRLDYLREEASRDFPLSADQSANLRESWREHVLNILDVEQRAVAALQRGME